MWQKIGFVGYAWYRAADAMFHNPTYASPPSHLTCYGSQGPRRTSADHTHPLVIEERVGEAVYHVLKDTGGGGGGKDEAVDYEVPTHNSSSRKGREILIKPSHTPGKADIEYSTLQHH